MRRSIAWIAAGWITGLAMAAVAPWAGGLPHARGAADALEIHVYLPLGLKVEDARALPIAATVVPPTPTATAPAATVVVPPVPTDPPTETATDTPTEPPTITPSPTPSATPTLKPGGAITGRLTIDGTPASEGLGGDFGPGLVLRKCLGEKECETVARTGVLPGDSDGRYVFDGPPALERGKYYQVTWINENPVGNESSEYAGAELWIGAWYGPRITSYQPGQTVDVGTFELADVVLVAPTHGTGFSGFPIQFEWKARAREVGNYSWSICEQCCQTLSQRIGHYHTPSLGRQTRYLLQAQPPGTQIGIEHKYCWFIRIDDERGGHGEGYRIRMMWFFFNVLDTLGIIDPAHWQG